MIFPWGSGGNVTFKTYNMYESHFGVHGATLMDIYLVIVSSTKKFKKRKDPTKKNP
jgi:hypothetical protein